MLDFRLPVEKRSPRKYVFIVNLKQFQLPSINGTSQLLMGSYFQVKNETHSTVNGRNSNISSSRNETEQSVLGGEPD